ncbi:MAG: thioredoxin [Elusimicrobia bacterium CG1_02_63_36]|nr:MAG: thioredoxin [Elusimicrobia bacterium CG1_02_63_36]PIP84532.1 MAG: thioredoxin [Elusimicrobia bacterium CG22_combo_CG10-13_8_21_14_all_63_91]PJB26852.1 MAG: thioredoxin [Elusimicrobia bacterium CG_4_9_14_3_um_filter_62_55]
MAELQLTDDNFEKEVLQATEPVLVDFWAPWCGPCRMLTPIVEELAGEYEGKVKVAKLNTDDNPNAATRFNISAIPTILFFKGGKVEQQLVGVHSKADIKKTLDELVAA